MDDKMQTKEKEITPRCMVAMPFRESRSSNVFSAIEDVMRNVRVDVFKVDTTRRRSLKLALDVESQIRSADIVIADVSTQNANVHIEIGLALANEKPLLICAQNDSDVCAHLSDYIFIKYTTDKDGLGELSRQVRLRIQEILERAQLEKESRILKLQLSVKYSVDCFRDRAVADLGTSFLNARNRIDILTTNLTWLFEKIDVSKQSDWECIMAAVERNEALQLRILTLNPQSEITAARGRQLGFDPGNFRDQLQKAYDKVRTFANQYQTNRVEVRLYDELPTQITFRIDTEVYTCIVGQPMQCQGPS